MTFKQWWEKYKEENTYYEAPWVDQRNYSIYSVRAAAAAAWQEAFELGRKQGYLEGCK